MQYDIDFEIIYSIKKGCDSFDKIWMDVNGKDKRKKIGSRSTLSIHLTNLVEDMRIIKKQEQGKIKYSLGMDVSLYEQDKGLIGKLNQKITTIEKNSKKLSNKELLKQFIYDTQDLLIVSSQIQLGLLSVTNMYKKENQGFMKPEIGIMEKKMDLINKLITIRIQILKERDFNLYVTFLKIIENNLQKFLS